MTKKTPNKNSCGLAVDQVERNLRSQLLALQASNESLLPHETKLADQHLVSRNTIRAALARLKQEGLIRSIPGKGTFIVPESERKRLTLVLRYDEDPMQNPFGAMAVNTALSLLRERNQAGLMAVVRDGDEDLSHLGLSPKDIAAVLVLGGPRAFWKAMSERIQMPMAVLADFHEPVRLPPFCPQFIPDQRAAAFLATQHLLSKGHRRISLMSWTEGGVWVRDLERGYREALEVAGVPFDDELVFTLPNLQNIDYTDGPYGEALESMKSRVVQLCGGAKAPTALIHNSSREAQLHEILRISFRDQIHPESVVTVGYEELLTNGFKGDEGSWSVAMPFRFLVGLALDRLESANLSAMPPERLIVDTHGLYRREKSAWQRVD